MPESHTGWPNTQPTQDPTERDLEKKRVICISENYFGLSEIVQLLKSTSYRITTVGSYRRASSILADRVFDICVVYEPIHGRANSVVAGIKRIRPRMPLLLMTHSGFEPQSLVDGIDRVSSCKSSNLGQDIAQLLGTWENY